MLAGVPRNIAVIPEVIHILGTYIYRRMWTSSTKERMDLPGTRVELVPTLYLQVDPSITKPNETFGDAYNHRSRN